MKRTFGRLAAAVALVAGLALSAGGTALAAPGTFAAGLARPAEQQVTVTADPLCESARSLDRSRGACAAVSSSSASASSVVDPAELSAADLSLKAADGTTLAQAAAAATIWTRTWWQEKRGLYYVNWVEKHTGRIYWNGTRVWSTTSFSGYKGTHVCDQGFGILYDVKVTNCSTENIGVATLKEWDYFRVHVVWSGIPIYASHNMHMTATKTGSLSFS